MKNSFVTVKGRPLQEVCVACNVCLRQIDRSIDCELLWSFAWKWEDILRSQTAMNNGRGVDEESLLGRSGGVVGLPCLHTSNPRYFRRQIYGGKSTG